jgi:act minimal PKS acyl carrier protein
MRKGGEGQMRVFTLAELRTIMRDAAGDVGVDGDVAHHSYGELGYDSLALLEISARIKQALGVEAPDSVLEVSSTLAQTVDGVNAVLAPLEAPV